MTNIGSIGSSPGITGSGPVSHDQKTSTQIHLNDNDKQELSRILSDSRNQTMDMAQIIDACCTGASRHELKQAFTAIKNKFAEISDMFVGDRIGLENTQKYMTSNAQIVLSLSHIFGQLHDGDGQVGKIFTELKSISSKFLAAYNDPTKASRMNRYVKKEKQDYFLNPSDHVAGVTQKTPMHVHFIADIRELFDLAASPGGGSAASPGGSRLEGQLDQLAGAGAPISSAKATPVMGGSQTLPPPSGSSPPTPPEVTGASHPETSTAVTGAGLTSQSIFETGGYFSNANVAESLDAIKAVDSGSDEEITELNQRSENAMGRSLRTSVDAKDVDPKRFGVPMKEGFPKPAQVALLEHVDPLLYGKMMGVDYYSELDNHFNSDKWLKNRGGPQIPIGSLGQMFMMDNRNPDAQIVLNEWQNTPGMVTIKDGNLVITSNVPLTKPGAPEAKAFLVRLFNKSNSIEFNEGGLASMKASIITEINNMAESYGMNIAALELRIDELNLEKEQCEGHYKQLNKDSQDIKFDSVLPHKPSDFSQDKKTYEDQTSVRRSSQYYRWSVLEEEIQTIKTLLNERKNGIDKLKEEIEALSQQKATNVSLLDQELGKELDEETIVKRLEKNHDKIMKKAESLCTKEVSGEISVEAYLAKRAPNAESAEDAQSAVSLESKDAKITLVYERWGRYHGLSFEKVKKAYNSDINEFLTAVSNSTQDEKMKMKPKEKKQLKEQLEANTTFFKSNTDSKWGKHQAREAPSDVRDLSQKTEKLNDPSAPLAANEFSVKGERKTINELTPTQQKQVRAANVLTKRYKALIEQRVAAEINPKELTKARQGMDSAVKESVQSYATYLAVQKVRWETFDGMSKEALLSPMCDRQADGDWVVRDNIFSGSKNVSQLNEYAKEALDAAMEGKKEQATEFLEKMDSIMKSLDINHSTHATYRTHHEIEMAKFDRINHTVESLTKEHAMQGIPLSSVTPATFSGPARIEQDSGDRAVFMHESPEMALLSDTSDSCAIQAKLDEYLRLTSAQVESKAREIMANCGVIQLGWGAFNVDQKIKAIQTRLKIQTNYPLTDAERAKFRDILKDLTPDDKTNLWTDCGGWRTFLDSSALQALCPAKINAEALDALFADPSLLNETPELSDDSIQRLFNVTNGWTHHDSGLLDAAMMCMPEFVRQKVAQYGPSRGQADHVNHQVRPDIPYLFERYMERLNALDPPPPTGSLNVIDSEFKAMVRLFSANSAKLSDEQKAKMKAIVEAKLSELTLDSITTRAHQEALAVFAETQGDLTNLGIKMGPLTALFFETDTSDGGKDTSWYAQANASGNPMVARFHSAMTYHALERALSDPETTNDEILKTMLALRSVENQRKKHGSGGNEFMNLITQCVSDPGLESQWRIRVKDSLNGLKGVNQDIPKLTRQLHRDIFSEQDEKINLRSSTLENFRYDSNSGQFKFTVKNEPIDHGEAFSLDAIDPGLEFSLDAIAMTLNSNAPKYKDISEAAKGVLKTVYYGDRDMGAGVHVCMGMNPSERPGELMTKDQRFLVKGDTVCVKASTGAGIEWREHVAPTEELHQKLTTLEHLSVWQSGTTLYFYDQHMDCQYKVDTSGQLIRLSDNKTLCDEEITADGFASLTWTAGNDGTTVVDMYKEGKKCGALTMNESMQYVNENEHVLVDTTANQLIFKDGTMFEVWKFDSSGLKQVLRSEDPVSKSPIPVKAYDQATITKFTKPVGAMSTLMWMANHPSEMNDALAWPSEKEVVPFDELTVWVDAHKSELGLMQQLRAHLDDLVIVDASGQAVEKDTVLRCMPPDSATPNDSNALMLLDAAVKRGDRDQINQLCGFIQERIDHVAQTPTQSRVLAGLVAGISNDELKEAMGIALDGVKVPSSRHIEAYRQLDKRDNNQLMLMADRTTYARGLEMPESFALDKDNANEFKNKVDQKYQTLRSQLDNMLVRLGMDPKDPMSTSYLLNAMIQGDPNGLIPATMREDVERLALNAMFMHTESQYLGDVVGLNSKPDEATELLGDNRHYVGLINDVQKGLASPEEKRLLALLMRCEQKLGHRLRKEQYDSVMGFINGSVSIAQLKTGFGKTDVLLFLLALYHGHGKGARITTPKSLIGMNATDYERKLQDFGVSVWQPSFSFIEARVKDKPLEQFLQQLTMHNNRGDICFAPIEFDMQLKDLRSESEVAWLNESDAEKKGKLKARIDLLDHIQQTMEGMFSVVDEAPLVKDVNKEFNVKAGKERMFDQERVEFCEKATKAIFKHCPDLFKGDICEIGYKARMNGIAQDVFNEVFGVDEETGEGNVRVPSGEPPFNLGEEEDWRTHFNVSKDSKNPTNGQLGLVVRMLTSSALEVSKRQLNWQYGFRRGDNQSLTAVPYRDKDVPTEVGTSFQDKEITTMYTVLAIQQNKKGYFGDPSKVSGILSFMATNAQELCQTYPAVFKASPETALSQLMALAIDVQSAYQGRPMRELSSEFDRLANAAMNDATDDPLAKELRPLAKELRRLMETIKVDDNQLNDLMFKVITNTKESERSFNANTNEIQTGHVQFSGTIDEGLIPAADLLRGTYKTVKVAVKGLDNEQDLAAVNEHLFGSTKINGATLHANGTTKVMDVADASLKGDIKNNKLIQTFLDNANQNNKVQLLVDSGALIQGLSNRQVAEYIQSNAEEVEINRVLYKQNVVYYDTETDQLRCITNDHGILSMPQLIAKVKGNEIRKETIKAFFDQARATGTDIMKVLLDDVEIMLTASTGMEKNEWVQGFGRMRGLGDKMHLVAPNSFVSEVRADGGGPVQIQQMWHHISNRTDMKMNQKILKRVQTELNGLIKDEVSKALNELSRELTPEEKEVVDGILCQTTSYDLSEFERPPKELSTQGALDEYLNRLLDKKRATLEQLEMFQKGNNFLDGVQFKRVHPPFNRQNLSLEPPKKDGDPFDPKDIATAIIQSANHIKTGHLAASPLKVSDANTQSQALAQATAQATVQAQATAQAQSQAQAQATAEGSAEVGVFTPSSDGDLTCKKTLLKRVDVKATLDEAFRGELTLDQNPSLHQFLTHMNVTNSIRFSHGFLSQCEPGKMPVVHHIFKKGDQYYVFTSEEVTKFKPQENGYTDVHDALFHGELGLVDASRNEPDTMESATLLALQCLIDGDHRNDLNMESRLNQAYERIFEKLISEIDMKSRNSIATGINYLNGQLGRLHGVDYFMATQLLGQLQAQVDEDPSVTLVARDGVFKPVTQKAKQPITIMGLVAGGQMDYIKQKMNNAIKGHFWNQEVLTRTSTFRAKLRTSMNEKMALKHQKACEKLTGELQAQWARFSTEAIKGEIQGLEDLIEVKEAEKGAAGTQRDDNIRRIQAELEGLRDKKAELERQIQANEVEFSKIEADIAGLTAKKQGKEAQLKDITSQIKNINQQKPDCEAHLRNLKRDEYIAEKEAEIARIRVSTTGLGPKSVDQILTHYGIKLEGMEIEQAVELVKIVAFMVVNGPFKDQRVEDYKQFDLIVKSMLKINAKLKYKRGQEYEDKDYQGLNFLKRAAEDVKDRTFYTDNKLRELYRNIVELTRSTELRLLRNILNNNTAWEECQESISQLEQLNQATRERLQESNEQIAKLQKEIQEVEGEKEHVPSSISQYTPQKAETIVGINKAPLLREQDKCQSLINQIDADLQKLAKAKSQLQEEIRRQNDELDRTNQRISDKVAEEVTITTANLRDTQPSKRLEGEIAALKTKLTQKKAELDQIGIKQKEFNAEVPNKIKAKMTELVKAYGFSVEEVRKLLPQFCPTDGSGNIKGSNAATLAADHGNLSITLPTFNAEANQIIHPDGTVNDDRLAARFEDDPLMQLLIAVECEAGDWITDDNGQRLQLTKDSKLIEETNKIRQYFTESNGEKVWFLLNSTLSLDKKLSMLNQLDGFKSKQLTGANDQVLKDLLRHITEDIDDSITSGGHMVVQAKDPGFFVSDSPSGVPCLKEAERLATMTHLPGLP